VLLGRNLSVHGPSLIVQKWNLSGHRPSLRGPLRTRILFLFLSPKLELVSCKILGLIKTWSKISFSPGNNNMVPRLHKKAGKYALQILRCQKYYETKFWGWRE
jgi:hypothetical protein